MYKLISVFFVSILSGCVATGAVEPKMSLYSLEDNNYPCVSVKFPEQIKYENMERIGTKDNTAIVYHLAMPGYQINVAKLYSKTRNWSLEPVSSLTDDISKIYEMGGEDEFADKSAIIKLVNDDGNLVLRGTIAEYMQNDIAVRIDINRTVKTQTVFRRDAVERWRNSTGGVRNIENMREIVDYIFHNMNTINCANKDAIDMKWW